MFPVFNLMKLEPGWFLIYEDPLSGLFIRKGSRLAEEIKRIGLPALPYDGSALCFP